MRTTRFLARAGAALAAVAALSIATSSAALAEAPAAQGQKQGSTQHSCDGSHHSDTGHGANTDGPDNPYHNTCDEDIASANGKGDGRATGRPAAGTVGNADDKNPRGQAPGPSDRNNGYECDGNQGIAKGNPAHTGCTAPVVTTPATVTTTAVRTVVAARTITAAPAVRGAVYRRTEARPAPAGSPATLVAAGVRSTRLDHRPLNVGGVTLPLTGGQARSLLAYAVMLIAAGSVLLSAGTRSTRSTSAS